MNFQELDILKSLYYKPFINQRILSEMTGHSIGVVNRSLRNLQIGDYLDNNNQLTQLAREKIERNSPQNAIILAAGFGMRMVPINYTTPKALLEVHGEVLIERTIKQLHKIGIQDISVVVGFMKECFEYLIDDFGVDLVVNNEYAEKNSLHSLALVADRISNTYIVPCDIWCETDPFSSCELYSWYMVSDHLIRESEVRVNRKNEIVKVGESAIGNKMIGISYLMEPEAKIIRKRLAELDDKKHSDEFWEEALFCKDRMIVSANIVMNYNAFEINTYEQLREIDSNSNHLKSDAIQTIEEVFTCKDKQIVDIRVLKKGMTNRSFLFSVNGIKYIMRIPGEGTELLVNRKQEEEVYKTICGLGICDDPIYLNADNGYKISSFLNNTRTCNPNDKEDLKKCMARLKSFHDMHLQVSHSFDIFEQIEFYEQLWNGEASVYRDYQKTKTSVFSLIPFIDSLEKDFCLTHIDAVPDNFLFYTLEDGSEGLQLTDWEYSGMQDPHVDVAMFCIYSLYDRKQCDFLIDMYFNNQCDLSTRAKIYCYISACGLLWSNWCEYKRKLGVEFGEYSIRQYRFAKDYFRYAIELIKQLPKDRGKANCRNTL